MDSRSKACPRNLKRPDAFGYGTLRIETSERGTAGMTSGEMMRFKRDWQKASDWKKSLDPGSLKKGFVRLLLLRGSLTKRLEALSKEAIEAEISKALRRGLAKDEG